MKYIITESQFKLLSELERHWMDFEYEQQYNELKDKLVPYIVNKIDSYNDEEDIIDLYDLDHVDFVKIDIEGSEIKFLSKENIETLNKYVKKFFIEFHQVNGKTYGEHREYYQGIFEYIGWNTELINVDVLYCYK